VGPTCLAQPRRVTALEGVVLRVAELLPGREKALDLGRTGAGQLVQGPRRDRRLSQCLDHGRAIAIGGLRERLRQRVAGGDERLERLAVQRIEPGCLHQ